MLSFSATAAACGYNGEGQATPAIFGRLLIGRAIPAHSLCLVRHRPEAAGRFKKRRFDSGLIELCATLQAKGVQDSATAAVRVSGLELGGLAGSLAAGWLSDKMVARASESGGGMVGARVKVKWLLSPFQATLCTDLC